MPETRDGYQIFANDLDGLKNELNFILRRMADRLDQMEGIRGTSSPAFNDVSVGGDITVTDSNDTVIHSLE